MSLVRDSIDLGRILLRLRPGPAQIANACRFGWDFMIRGRRPAEVRGYRPVAVGLYINQICNLKCSFCYLNWDDDTIPRENMTLKQAEGILAHDTCSSAIRLFVGGGEPLLHRQYFDFVELGTRRGMYTVTHSNGLLINRQLEQLSRSALSCLTVSLYDEHIDKQLENMALLIRENRKVGNPMRVAAARLVSSESYGAMEGIIERCLAAGVGHLLFQNHFPASWPSGNVDHAALHLPIRADNAEYRRHARRLERKYGSRLNISWPALLKEREPGGDSCMSLYGVINFDQRGSVSPCCFIAPPREEFGTAADPDVWNTPFYRELRGSLVRPEVELGASCGSCSLRCDAPVKVF